MMSTATEQATGTHTRKLRKLAAKAKVSSESNVIGSMVTQLRMSVESIL